MLRCRSAPVLLTIVIGHLVGGCTAWKVQSAPPEQVLTEKRPNRVRVTRADGSTIELVNPLIAGDTLSGRPDSAAANSAGRVTVPLSDVRYVAVQGVHAGKTVLLVAGLGLTAVAIAAAVSEDEAVITPGNPAVSCPLVYSWDGTTWRLDSGTFGGAIAPAFARTDLDNLVYAVPENGMLRLRIANELAETDYLDALSLLAVDHPAGFTVAPDGDGRIHTLGRLIPPAAARDFRSADALPRVRAADGWSWESNPSGRDTAVAADIRDGLELTFPRPGRSQVRLVLDGHNSPWAAYLIQEFVAAHGTATQAWYDSLEANPALARTFGAMLAHEAFLGVSVWADGRWQHQGYIWEAGPEIVKRQVFQLDLSRVAGDSVRIRLESAPSFWLIDHLALDSSAAAPFEVRELFAESATDQAGADVSQRVRSPDHRYFVMQNGEAAEMRFRVPVVPAGRTRSYLVRSSGWYRIHGPETEPPDTGILSQVLTQPHGASRVAVARFNDALLALELARP